MNKIETALIMALLQVAFPAFYRNQSEESAAAAVNLWSEMFADEPAELVEAAVKSLIATQVESYPPTIASVKARISELREPDRMTAQEAWIWAKKGAEGNCRFEDLPELVQGVIGSPNVLKDWGQMDVSTFNSVVYSNFLRAFNAYEKREHVRKSLPASASPLIASVADKLKLE